MTAKKRSGFRLHTKFIGILIAVSLVPLVVVTVVSIMRFQLASEADASRLGTQLAATASAEIQTFMVSQLQILDNIAILYQPQFPIAASVAESTVENILFKSQNFSDISVVNAKGKEIVRKDLLLVITPSDLRDRSTDPEFTSVKKNGVYVGPVYVLNGRPYFDMGLEITDEDGSFAGAVFAQVDARVMPSVVATISKELGSTGRVYVVDKKGTVIAHPDLSYVLAQKNLSQLPLIHQIVTTQTDQPLTATYVNEAGDEVLGSAQPMTIQSFASKSYAPHLDWYVVAEQPVSVVFKTAYDTALFAALISIAAMILAAILALYFAGRIVRPIESLHTAALKFGAGNLGHRAPVETGDEIGELAQSFNAMAETIGKSMLSLRRDEEVVTAERTKLTLILGGITNAIIATDGANNIILFNSAAEALTGLDAKAVLGKKVGDIITLYDGEVPIPVDTYCPPHPAISEGIVFEKRDVRLIDTKHREHFLNLFTGRIKQGISIDLGYILTFQDVTQMYFMDRTQREFVSIAAHQLRTPLTGLKWAVDYLVQDEKGTLAEDQKKIAASALDATNRMIRLVGDLLNVSRVEDGRLQVTPEVQSFEPLYGRLRDVFSKEAAKRGLSISFAMPDPLPTFAFDQEKLEIVLDNLIDNAIKYTLKDGRIDVAGRIEGDHFLITVADTGLGIPKDDAEHIFMKFYRSQKVISHHTDGSGLGLYVAKYIVEQHGGRIWFESVEGKGTTFFVSLPLARA